MLAHTVPEGVGCSGETELPGRSGSEARNVPNRTPVPVAWTLAVILGGTAANVTTIARQGGFESRLSRG